MARSFTRSATRSAARRPGVVVEGVDAVVRDLTRRADVIAPAVAGVTVQFAERLAQRMRDLAPVLEGDVLDSITADDRVTKAGSSVYADAGPDPSANDQAFVARFLEHGTVKMAPQPFVGPAADAVLPEYERALRALL